MLLLGREVISFGTLQLTHTNNWEVLHLVSEMQFILKEPLTKVISNNSEEMQHTKMWREPAKNQKRKTIPVQFIYLHLEHDLI